MSALVSENGAVDSILPAVVDEVAPHEQGVGVVGSQHDLFPGADELVSGSPISVSVAGVMPLIECETFLVAVLGEPP